MTHDALRGAIPYLASPIDEHGGVKEAVAAAARGSVPVVAGVPDQQRDAVRSPIFQAEAFASELFRGRGPRVAARYRAHRVVTSGCAVEHPRGEITV